MSTSSSFSSEEKKSPIWMKNPESLFDLKLKQRLDKKKVFSQYNKIIKSYIKSKEFPQNYIIGGSHAYYKILSNNSSFYNKLSTIEKTSIEPLNMDLFFIHTSIDNIKKLLLDLFKYSNKIIKNFENEMRENKYEIITNEFQIENNEITNFNNNPDGIILPGYELSIKVYEDDKEYIIFYVKVFLFDDIDIKKKFEEYYTKNKLLNIDGLWIFNQIIKEKREKEYNIDLYRKKIIEKYVKDFMDVDLKSFYYFSGLKYKEIFSNFNQYYNNYLYQDLVSIPFTKGTDLFKSLDDLTISILRGYINQCILNIHKYIENKYNKSLNTKKPFVMITGGDAFRRYLSQINKTADIDIKICIPPEFKKDFIDIREKVKYYLTELVLYLELFKNNLFNNVKNEYQTQFNGNLTIKYIRKNINQFRLRYIEKNPKFPIDLLSIDFRTTYIFKKIGNKKVIRINNDLPILDVSLELDCNYDMKKTQKIINKLPVASKRWLLKDLKTMYTTPYMIERRYEADKSIKDYTRFKSIKSKNKVSVSILNKLSILTNYKLLNYKYINYYTKYFNKIVSGNKKENKVKHKIGFGDKNMNKYLKNLRKITKEDIKKTPKSEEFIIEINDVKKMINKLDSK